MRLGTWRGGKGWAQSREKQQMAQSVHISDNALAIKVPVMSEQLCTIEPIFNGNLENAATQLRVMSVYLEELHPNVDTKWRKLFFVQYLCVFDANELKPENKNKRAKFAYYILKYVTNKSSIVSTDTPFTAVLKNPARICIAPTLHDAFKLDALGILNTLPMFRI